MLFSVQKYVSIQNFRILIWISSAYCLGAMSFHFSVFLVLNMVRVQPNWTVIAGFNRHLNEIATNKRMGNQWLRCSSSDKVLLMFYTEVFSISGSTD